MARSKARREAPRFKRPLGRCRRSPRTFEEFERDEGKAFRRFVDKHAVEDFLQPALPVYSRTYTCECGFRTHSVRRIYDHRFP